MTPPQNCKCDVIHCVPCLGAGFPELRQVEVGDVPGSAKVSSVVGLVDVESVLAQACQIPGGQISICPLKWFLAFHLFRL